MGRKAISYQLESNLIDNESLLSNSVLYTITETAKIILPKGHDLPRFRSLFKDYDRFLPSLVTQLREGACVVDIGANVGDTFCLMAHANPWLKYVLVEPDKDFRKYLEMNATLLRQIYPDRLGDSVILDAFVGTIGSVVLKGGSTTKTTYLAVEGTPRVPLDDIIDSYANVKVIKIDVDGFDYDVINSGIQKLSNHPILFFELLTRDDETKLSNYLAMIKTLIDIGYEDFLIFDNYGSLIQRTKDFSEVEQIVSNVYRMRCESNSPAVYYLDVCASHASDQLLVDAAVDCYLKVVS